ncbi:HNH endonuclease signature motif containing protein [Thiococcus pfennigii]|uniref:HNH endonuclease signature motif containing protein n=1 Tax=Thiococcus pfennigii TaxID=1057 RepID=UPI0019079D54|nr:HNH endonuclease signature motif containing protein [Thiococcus pfennigii]MBK1699778.1 hypothetical protein [Thiococcus pfennigii]
MMARIRFTAEQIDWLRQEFPCRRVPALTSAFNRHFGLSLSEGQIRCALKNHRVLSGRRGRLDAAARAVWTPPRVAVLRMLRQKYSTRECAETINARYGLNLTPSAIKGACARFGIPAATDGRFKPGSEAYKMRRTPNRSNAGSFRPGNRPHNTHPIGAYRLARKDGWLIRVQDSGTPYRARFDWRPVRHLVYEEHYGPVPDGHIVLLLDGDQDNCLDPDNLIAVTRAVMARLNQAGFSDLPQDRDIRRAVVAEAIYRQAAHARGRAAGLRYAERRALITPVARP